MKRPFTCDHPEEKTSLRKRLTGGGTVMLGHQCQECGRLVGKWVRLERVPHWRTLPEWDYNIEPRWELAERRYMQEYRKERVKQEGVAAFAKPEPETKRADFWTAYKAYLSSPQWKDKRSLVLSRAHGVCEGCGLADATQVHHTTYARVGKEMLFDLVAVCEACHEIIHV